MDLLEMQSLTTMDKKKLIKVAMWLSGFSINVICSAIFLFIGFNNQRYGDNTILIIGILFIPMVFYCAFKTIRLFLDIIFKK